MINKFFEKLAIEILKNYTILQAGIVSLSERLEEAEYEYKAIKASDAGRMHVSGTGRSTDDRLADNMTYREYLKDTIEARKADIAAIDNALSVLDERERTVIDKLYIQDRKGRLNELTEELYIEKSQLYRIKDEAIYKFNRVYFGRGMQ